MMSRGSQGMLNDSMNQGSSAMEALAARYNSAAINTELQQQGFHRNEQQLPPTGRNGEYSSDIMHLNGMKKVRTKEEQAEGRMLLGFLQELQSNHLKAAKLNTGHNFPESIDSMPPQLKSTGASTDGTSTTRESLSSSHNSKDTILKKEFDIPVKKDNAEGSSTVSSYYESVHNNEALSGSSGGSSGENDLSGDDKDDGDKDTRAAGPLRKRFRRAGSKVDDDIESQS